MTKVIAVVDDDRNILTSVSMALENEGFKVQTIWMVRVHLLEFQEHRLT